MQFQTGASLCPVNIFFQKQYEQLWYIYIEFDL
jgi:hypothetical protein